MLEARPIVIDKDGVVLGGNMRLRAAQLAGLDEVPVYVREWDQDKDNQFVIKDNVSFGEWDWDIIANEWQSDELNEWGMDVWDPSEEPELDDFFETVNDAKDERFKIVLDYTEDDYNIVVELFDKHQGSKEAIVLKLLSA